MRLILQATCRWFESFRFVLNIWPLTIKSLGAIPMALFIAMPHEGARARLLLQRFFFFLSTESDEFYFCITSKWKFIRFFQILLSSFFLQENACRCARKRDIQEQGLWHNYWTIRNNIWCIFNSWFNWNLQDYFKRDSFLLISELLWWQEASRVLNYILMIKNWCWNLRFILKFAQNWVSKLFEVAVMTLKKKSDYNWSDYK